MGHTKHAAQRLKQRTAYGKGDAERMATEALENGRHAKEFKGGFRKYLDKISMQYHTSPIVYKGSIYIFNRELLVTILPLNQKFHKYVS